MYIYNIAPSLQKTLNKLFKRDKKTYEVIINKIEKILKNPRHYKPLKYSLAGERRVHIMKSFVLKYKINENEEMITFLFFGHHDEAYKR